MPSVLDAPYFRDEAAAYEKLESIIWPNGPVCQHCGERARISRMKGKATRAGLLKCYACRKQFRATVNTVFEASHIPLHMWLQATFLMCSSKKGISSNQLHRTLGVTLKSAWFMSHRLREAMKPDGIPPMGGKGEVVEIDETFIGRKEGVPVRRGYAHKHAVMTLIERGEEGGRSRSFHVSGTAAADLLPIIKAHVNSGTHVMTDEAGQYAHLNKSFAAHDFVTHGAGEYGRGIIHANSVENFYSVFKRGMKGIYQHCGEQHLHRYVTEFDFRYNYRVRLGFDDQARMDAALRGIVGRRLTYKPVDRSA